MNFTKHIGGLVASLLAVPCLLAVGYAVFAFSRCGGGLLSFAVVATMFGLALSAASSVLWHVGAIWRDLKEDEGTPP